MKSKINVKYIKDNLSLIFLSISLSYLTNYRFLIWGDKYGRNFGFLYFFISLFLYFFISKKLIGFFISINNYFCVKVKQFPIQYMQKFSSFVISPLSIIFGIVSLTLGILTHILFYIGLNSSEKFGYIFIAEKLNLKLMPIIMLALIFILITLNATFFYKIEKSSFLQSLFISILSSTLLSILVFIWIKIAYGILWMITLIVSILAFGPVAG